MKTLLYYLTIILGAALITLAPVLISGCSKPATQSAVGADVDYWTCTMHPSVHSKDPGKCPICSMDLVPVKKSGGKPSETKTESANANGGSMDGMNMSPSKTAMSNGETNVGPSSKSSGESTEFTVPVERQQQIGVTYAGVKKRPIQFSIRSVGLLEADTSKMFDYVARVDGYAQELEVSSPGQQVSAGQPLLTIYSPDLRSSEQELINLLNDRDRGGNNRSSNDQLIQASKMRLKLWNVSEQEIAELERNRKPSDQLTLRSPFDGVVNEVMVRPGMSVKMGDKLVSVLDLSNLWVWAEFYENEVGLLKPGESIEVSLAAFPNQVFHGQIAVINPVIDAVKRTSRVRIDIPNPNGQLRPGMYANVQVKIDAGQGLTIPTQAALPTGERMLVFLDRGEGKLLPRYIQVGRSFTTSDGQEDSSYYQVLSGLQEGDRIVASANFLIDAESQVQGALKDWQGEQPEATPGATAKTPEGSPHTDFNAAVGPVVESYKTIHESLATNRFADVKTEVERLRKGIHGLVNAGPGSRPERYKELLEKLDSSADRFVPEDIEQARVDFGQLSADLIAFLKEFTPQSGDQLYTVKCPMWNRSPAVWLQDSTDVRNPFLGPGMLTCGNVQGALRAER